VTDLTDDVCDVVYDVVGTPLDIEWQGLTMYALFENIKNGFPALDEVKSCAGPDAKDLVTRLLMKDPFKRITLDECLRHPFIRFTDTTTPKFRLTNPLSMVLYIF
jgi:serine/threonine protein kinase